MAWENCRDFGPSPPSTPVRAPTDILHGIRIFTSPSSRYPAFPTAISLLTGDFSHVLFLPSSYPFCDVGDHQPSSTISIHVTNSHTVPFPTQPGDSPYNPPHQSTLGGSSGNALRLSEETDIIIGPPWSSTAQLVKLERALKPAQSLHPPHRSHRPTFTDGPHQRDIVTPYAELDIDEVLSTACTPAPTPTPASAPESAPLVLNKSLPSYGTGSAFAANPSLPTSSVVGFPTPASPPQSRVPPLLNPGFLALLSSATVAAAPSCPTSHATRLRPRVRGLVNSGSMCFANATLQLLVHSAPFWNLFRELGDLKAQRRAGDLGTGSGAMPLVDAMVRFFEEFRSKAKEPLPTQLPLQQAASGKSREDEEEREEHSAVDSFEPLYMYDAMREKRQLKHLLDGQQWDTEEFFRLYLDALDEELPGLLVSLSGHKAAAVAPGLGVEDRKASQSDQTDVSFTVHQLFFLSALRFVSLTSRSIVRVPNQPDTTTVQDWRLLKLNIQPDFMYTVKDALAYISQSQPVQVGQQSPGEVSQQVQIEALPPVLVLHLERFLYDAAADGKVKINKPIQFGPELEIPLEIMAPVTGKSVEPTHYKLYGVLYHHGESAGSEHYTVDVLHAKGDGGSGEAWLHIDDENYNSRQALDAPLRGGDEPAPEHRNTTPCNPFYTDIYYLGNLVRREFIQKYNGFEFMQNLVDEMTHIDPTKRPLIEDVMAKFLHISKSISGSKLLSPVVSKHKPSFFTIVRCAFGRAIRALLTRIYIFMQGCRFIYSCGLHEEHASDHDYS
ncbi:hypothetical protein BJV77DRAFT_1069714 [Russula vinacea]|nr:hypothetical protein BJV77DRAFT_1069714 [Russula vinacea]